MSDAPNESRGVPVATRRPVIPDYELLRPIGSGSYGDVWLARGVTGIFRAVKVVWRERFADAEPFEREFRGLKEFAAISLKTEGQMALLHIGRNDDGGFFYYVMELADDANSGRTFDPSSYVPLTLKELKHRKGRVSAAEVIAIGAELATGLAALHAHGLVHRDIKPSNAIIVNGKAKLADIGLVSAAHEAKTFIGTSGYVPPEGPGAPSADVFALGRVLYELATGLERDEFPKLPPALDRMPDRKALLELNEVLLRACAQAPASRYGDAAALAADLSAMRSGLSLRRQRSARRAVRAGAAIIAVAAVIIAWNWRDRIIGTAGLSEPQQPFAASLIPVAVLPLTAPPSDHDAVVFAGGMHTELIATLARNAGLKVIARNSTLVAGGPGKSRGDIARALGVGHLVSGSVARTRSGFRVTLELHAADSDRARWSGTFDCAARDLLRIQPDIARQVARALGAPPFPTGALPAADRPLDNIASYELLAKARNLLELDETSNLDVLPLLEEAVRLDPESFLAWAELGSQHAHAYFLGLDRSQTRRDLARSAVDTAVRLAPESPEVILAQGNLYYWCFRDYSRAAERYRRLLAIRPSSAQAYALLGAIDRRQGRWSDAVANLQRSLDLDPIDVRSWHQLLEILTALRRYGDAVPLSRRLAELFPDKNYEKFEVADVEFLATGSTREADRLLANFVPEPGRENEKEHWERMWAINRGDYATAARLESNHPFLERAGFIDGKEGQEVDAATWLYFAGRIDDARKRAAMAKPVYLERIQREPENPSVIEQLATIAMIEGNDEDALRYARRVLDVGLERGDTQAGPRLQGFHASVLAWTGATERALDELERLLKVPYGGNVHILRRRQLGWLKLHGNPRFEALLADPANNAPFNLATGRPITGGVVSVSSLLGETAPAAPAAGRSIAVLPEDGSVAAPPSRPAMRKAKDAEKKSSFVPKAEDKSAPADKSIAVLPFENRSTDKENEFFTDGVHEDIVTNLALIRELRVVSRTSVRSYRGTTKPMKQIAEELGVSFILEGSVRRAGNRVRVTGQLIRAATDEHVWAQTYDRDLTDIFAIQSELSQQIAAALQTALSPEERTFIARRPTENPAAYDAYLEGRRIQNNNTAYDSESALQQAGELFQRAVRLDPNFAAAWGDLAVVNALQVFSGFDASASHLAEADAAIAQAVRLAPDDPSVIESLGTYAYYGYRDYPRARQLYERLAHFRPNDAGVFHSLGLIQRRQGDWAGSVENFRRAAELDPANIQTQQSLKDSLWAGRRWDELRAAHQRMIAISADPLRARLAAATDEFRATGSLQAADDLLVRLPPAERESPLAVYFRRSWAFYRRDFAEFRRLDTLQPDYPSEANPDIDAFDAGRVYRVLGDSAALQARIAGPLARQRLKVQREPANETALAWLAGLEALAGNGAEATKLAAKAAAMLPESRDALAGPKLFWHIALVAALNGDKDTAVAGIGHLLSTPSGFSVAEIRVDPAFDGLRGDPRFEQLLSDPKHNAPLF